MVHILEPAFLGLHKTEIRRETFHQLNSEAMKKNILNNTNPIFQTYRHVKRHG